MKIGILGGTFDPIHRGHLYIAKEVKRRLGLAQVWMMPAAQSPFKQQRQTVSFEQRFQMVQQAIQEIPGCFASRFEGLRGGVSYTVDTIRALCRLHPQDEFWLIMGADAYAGFFRWREPETILSLVRLAVVTRPGYAGNSEEVKTLSPELAGRIQFLALPGMDVSSTQVREKIREGKENQGVLHPTTEAYIRAQDLYKK